MIIRRKTASGKTRYGVRVDRNGKQEWIGTYATRGEARTAELNARTAKPQTKMTCDAYVDHWLEGYLGRAKGSSYDTAASALRKFKIDWAGVALSTVTRMEAEKWARKNNWRMPVVVSVFNAAVDADLIARNPFAGLSHKGPGRRHNKPLTVAEVDRLAAIAERLHGQSMRSFVLFAAYSALRVGEMFGLEWADIDFDRNRIADNHLGYSQPIGGAVAYRDHISPSGVGYDIGCGNKAVRTTIKRAELDVSKNRNGVAEVMDEIVARISFGVGRVNDEPVDHPVFDSIRNAPFAPQRQLLDEAVKIAAAEALAGRTLWPGDPEWPEVDR